MSADVISQKVEQLCFILLQTGGGERRWWSSRRVCTNPETPQGGSYCCGGCSSVPPSWFADNGMTCATANDNTFTREELLMKGGWLPDVAGAFLKVTAQQFQHSTHLGTEWSV